MKTEVKASAFSSAYLALSKLACLETANHRRLLVKMVEENARDLGYNCSLLCYAWVIQLAHQGRVRRVFGYTWELNSAAAYLLAQDKAATYALLSELNIPAIEHRLFFSPQQSFYVGHNGNWPDLLAYAAQHDFQLVCKSNEGTGGNHMFKVSKAQELETAVHQLFAQHRTIAVCPYHDIPIEYRVILLDGEVQLVFAKHKPQVKGNGRQTLLELLQQSTTLTAAQWMNFTENTPTERLHTVPANGEVVELHWQHNLGKGAQPQLIEPSNEPYEAVTQLAKQALSALQLRFASVDLAQTEAGLLVMEVNAGVMMENFARMNEAFYNLSSEIYRKAMVKMMESD